MFFCSKTLTIVSSRIIHKTQIFLLHSISIFVYKLELGIREKEDGGDDVVSEAHV